MKIPFQVIRSENEESIVLAIYATARIFKAICWVAQISSES
jgi:hypothetical protein